MNFPHVLFTHNRFECIAYTHTQFTSRVSERKIERKMERNNKRKYHSLSSSLSLLRLLHVLHMVSTVRLFVYTHDPRESYIFSISSCERSRNICYFIFANNFSAPPTQWLSMDSNSIESTTPALSSLHCASLYIAHTFCNIERILKVTYFSHNPCRCMVSMLVIMYFVYFIISHSA